MPYPNYHSCRINSPDKYDKIRTDKNAMKVNGKYVDVLYGIKDDKTEIQAYRYPTSLFSESEAKDHCSKKNGSFHPASKKASAKTYMAKSEWAILEEELKNVLDMATESYEVFFDTGDSSFNEPSINDRTAKIELVGPLFKYSNILTVIGVGTSLEDASYQLEKAIQLKKNKKIDNVELFFDTPGGQASGVDAFANKVYNLRDELNITAKVNGMCCSGGYWIASAAKNIQATSDSDMFGSVGVILSIERAEDDEYVIVSSNAPNKYPDPSTEEGKKVIQEHIDKLESIFIEKVATYRNTTTDNVKSSYGKGGALFTQDALKVGMIDEIQTFGGNMEITAQFLKENHEEVVSELVNEAVEAKKNEFQTSLEQKDSKIQELETELAKHKEEETNDLPPEAKATLNEYKEKLDAMEKDYLKSELSFCNDDQREKLMDLHGHVKKEKILEIGGIIKIMQDTINELGKAKGHDHTPDQDATFDQKVEKRKKELVAEGFSEYDAYHEAYKQVQ